MVKPKEIQPLGPRTVGQVHDSGLGAFQLQPELGQQLSQPRQRGFGLLPGPAHHHQIISEANQHAILAYLPGPIDLMQIHIAQQRTDHTPCGIPACSYCTTPSRITPARSIARSNVSTGLVTDTFLNRPHQPFTPNRRETIGDIGLDHPPPTPAAPHR
jgi:hypothetical protein